MNTETIRIPGIAIPVSRIGLGSWAIGGWMWGGSDDMVSITTIRGAVDPASTSPTLRPSRLRPCR
jgi:hypothetical protein